MFVFDMMTLPARIHDDPLLLDWALRYYEGLSNPETKTRLASLWFHDVMMAGLAEKSDFNTLLALFRALPKEHFANLTPLIVSRWVNWPGHVAGAAVPILAHHDPEAWMVLLEREMDRFDKGVEMDPNRFRGLRSLHWVSNSERRAQFIERLAAFTLQQPPEDYRTGFLLGSLLPLGRLLGVDILERVLISCLSAEQSQDTQDSALKRLFEGIFNRSEYLDWVLARMNGESSQKITALPSFFEPSTPLEQLDHWVDSTAPLSDVLPLLQEIGQSSVEAATLSQLIQSVSQSGYLSEQRLVGVAIAGCLHGYAVEHLDASILDLPATLTLLQADLDNPRWFSVLRDRLTAFPKEEVLAQLQERLPEICESYGDSSLMSAMGSLGWPEFIPSLVDALNDSQPDFMCAAAQEALVPMGKQAREALENQWVNLDVSQKIMGLSIIRGIRDEGAIDFALSHWDELLKEQTESFCELLLAVPDIRALERLRQELPRKQRIIDRCYAILAQLLDCVDDHAHAARERALLNEAQSNQLRQKMDRGDYSRDSLTLSLRCAACGGVNEYEAQGVILPGLETGDLPYLIEDEFPCASCGEWAEFEFTPEASMAMMAETGLIMAAHQADQQRRPLLRLFDCEIDGQVVPIAAGIRRCRERLRDNDQDGVTWYQLGLMHRNIRHPRAALAAFDKAADLMPLAVSVTLQRVELLSELDREEDALDLLIAAWPDRQSWVVFGNPHQERDPQKVLNQFIKLYNYLKRRLGRDELPTLHPAVIKATKRPGRNDPCSCGSGKKYKKCCGA